MPINHPFRKQQGFTLLEALLAIALSMLLMSALNSVFAESQRELRAKAEAEQMRSFQSAAAEYFLAYRTAMLEAMEPGTDATQDPDQRCLQRLNADTADVVICSINAFKLQGSGFLPGNFSNTNTFGEPLLALFRRTLDDELVLTNNVEMLVVAVATEETQTTGKRRQTTSLSAASQLGASGGVLPTHNNPGRCGIQKTSGQWICGNGWEVDLNSFGLQLHSP